LRVGGGLQHHVVRFGEWGYLFSFVWNELRKSFTAPVVGVAGDVAFHRAFQWIDQHFIRLDLSMVWRGFPQ
ncbi:MAG: hypothetical protein WCW30_01695, partial [Candidatus Gracilibacteria bacterium]